MTIEKAVEQLRWLAENSRALAGESPDDHVSRTDLDNARAIDVVLRELRKHEPRARSRRTVKDQVAVFEHRRRLDPVRDFFQTA